MSSENLKFENQRLADSLAAILHYAVKSSNTEVDETVVGTVQSALDDIDLDEDADPDSFVEAVFDILDLLTDLTPSEADDKIVDFLEPLVKAFVSGDKVRGFIQRIRDRIKARREARNAANSESAE